MTPEEKFTETPTTSSWQGCWQQLLEALVVVRQPSDMETQLFEPLRHLTRPTVMAFVNAHAMNSVVGHQRFGEALAGADLLLRDGAGMRLLLLMLGRHPGVNLNGTDLIPKLLERYEGRRVALYGTVEPYLSKAARYVQRDLAHGAQMFTCHGFGSAADYVGQAQRDRPDIIVLGMGMPKQETIAAELRRQLQYPCLIVCGGAIIDFMGDRFDRAPMWMRRCGLEWLFRLQREPKRLFKRYVIGNPAFLLRSLMLMAR
ncbi:WecB/TagA/CpsF family glycosyltransferase [Ideonella sp.]|jgi:exopolysaccharide biosynthesis WecB/TagA/CpsF family protein|uniref:WecB/TagA/CpsF family glycosyltransferase n=1 Tax=Ideonella sp. TaxID=1929293 RepID=UPI0037BF769F